jgi:hypothetical protein
VDRHTYAFLFGVGVEVVGVALPQLWPTAPTWLFVALLVTGLCLMIGSIALAIASSGRHWRRRLAGGALLIGAAGVALIILGLTGGPEVPQAWERRLEQLFSGGSMQWILIGSGLAGVVFAFVAFMRRPRPNSAPRMGVPPSDLVNLVEMAHRDPKRLTHATPPIILFRPAAVSADESIILLNPVDGAVVHSPVFVRGFADTFEGNVVVQLLQPDGTWATLSVTTVSGGALGYPSPFSTMVELSPGEQFLSVGSGGGRHLTWNGVIIRITVANEVG